MTINHFSDEIKEMCEMAQITDTLLVPAVCSANDRGLCMVFPIYYHKDAAVELQCIRHELHNLCHEFHFLLQLSGKPVSLLKVIYGTEIDKDHPFRGEDQIISAVLLDPSFGTPMSFLKRNSQLHRDERVEVCYITPQRAFRVGYRVGIGDRKEVFVPEVCPQWGKEPGKSVNLYEYRSLPDGGYLLKFTLEDPFNRFYVYVNEKGTVSTTPVLMRVSTFPEEVDGCPHA